jgi:hypothetical protein
MSALGSQSLKCLVLAAALLLVSVASEAQPAFAEVKCTSLNCKSGCIVAKGWCNRAGAMGAKLQRQFASGVCYDPNAGQCTDGAVSGTPALYQVVAYDEYTDYTSDCAGDVTTVWTTGAFVGMKSGSSSGTYKTSCASE